MSESIDSFNPGGTDAHKELLKEVIQSAASMTDLISGVVDIVRSGPDLSAGNSFVGLKNSLLLEYIANLAYLVLRKSSGKSINGDKAVERLVKVRTVMEKIRPIDQKLKYQIDKLVGIAEAGAVAEDDPLGFKPNPGQMMSKLGSGDEDEDEDSEADGEGGAGDSTGKKYVVPKNVPQHFNENKTAEEMEQEQVNKKKRHQLSRSLIDELKTQYWDTPEEVSHHVDTRKKKYIQEMKEQIAFEEDNFMRLPVTKADKQKRRMQMSTMGTIGGGYHLFRIESFRRGRGGYIWWEKEKAKFAHEKVH